jgi:hypothetical protein
MLDGEILPVQRSLAVIAQSFIVCCERAVWSFVMRCPA